MKKLMTRLAIFILPLLLFLAVPVYVLYQTKENFTNPDAFIPGNRKYLIGYAYNESNYSYLKWKTLVSKEKKTVMALGSSRVLQFRDKMFSASFYNAGYTITGVRDFVPFLESIPKEKLPDYLIIGLDQWMFNASWDNLSGKLIKDKWAGSFRKNPNLTVINHVWKDLFSKKYGLDFPNQNDSVTYIGLNAAINKKGFRNDGSMDYGNQLAKLARDTTGHYDAVYDRIKSGSQRFEFGNKANPKAVIEVGKLLAFCKTNHIEVVAFLPPFGNQVFQKMQASGHYQYVREIYPSLQPLFQRYGFECYDFSNVNACNSNDNETIDGFHGGEFTYLKMLVKVLESGSNLNKVAHLKQLQQDATHRINNYSVYK